MALKPTKALHGHPGSLPDKLEDELRKKFQDIKRKIEKGSLLYFKVMESLTKISEGETL